jgi:acyl carrier protein
MTLDKVKQLLAEQLNVSADKIKAESRVIEDLGADSLDVVEMLMTLEDNFNVTVTDEESVNLKTVGDIVKLIDSKTAKN